MIVDRNPRETGGNSPRSWLRSSEPHQQSRQPRRRGRWRPDDYPITVAGTAVGPDADTRKGATRAGLGGAACAIMGGRPGDGPVRSAAVVLGCQGDERSMAV